MLLVFLASFPALFLTGKKKKVFEGHLGGLVKHLTLDLSSGLDLRVLISSPTMGFSLGEEPT